MGLWVQLSLVNVREICEPACFTRLGPNTDRSRDVPPGADRGQRPAEGQSPWPSLRLSPCPRVPSRKRLPTGQSVFVRARGAVGAVGILSAPGDEASKAVDLGPAKWYG